MVFFLLIKKIHLASRIQICVVRKFVCVEICVCGLSDIITKDISHNVNANIFCLGIENLS